MKLANGKENLPIVFLCVLEATTVITWGAKNERWRGVYRVLHVNSAFRKKNLKYNAGFKNMSKLVRLGMGGNGRRCERRPLANLKAGVHNAGY